MPVIFVRRNSIVVQRVGNVYIETWGTPCIIQMFFNMAAESFVKRRIERIERSKRFDWSRDQWVLRRCDFSPRLFSSSATSLVSPRSYLTNIEYITAIRSACIVCSFVWLEYTQFVHRYFVTKCFLMIERNANWEIVHGLWLLTHSYDNKFQYNLLQVKYI